MYKVGDIVVLNQEGLDSRGEEFRGVRSQITHVSTKCMPAEQFFAYGMLDGYSPGYDPGVGQPLYSLKTNLRGQLREFDVYHYEVMSV